MFLKPNTFLSLEDCITTLCGCRREGAPVLMAEATPVLLAVACSSYKLDLWAETFSTFF